MCVTHHRDDEELISRYIKDKKYQLVVNTVDYDFNKPVDHPHGEASKPEYRYV